ncbi:MAG: GCD complex subunit gcd7, partial [Chaenotheca gracillima]
MENRPDYLLRFEYQKLFQVLGYLERATIQKIFGQILIGYGVNILSPLLFDAAIALSNKLESDPDEKGKRQAADFSIWANRTSNRQGNSNSRKSDSIILSATIICLSTLYTLGGQRRNWV